jgi:hypothetical protein
LNRAATVAVILVLALAAGGALLWWRHQPPRPVTAAPAAPLPVAAPAPPPPAAPAVQYAVPPAEPLRGRLPALDDSDGYFENALIDLLGRKSVRSFLHLDGIVRGFVATVNNLANDNASSQLWPVNPTPGRFDAEARDGGTVISAKNAERYTPFVRFATGIDTARAVALYLRVYPLLQAAYEDLGYPGKYFNDRVLDTIDDLLATPTVPGPIKVKRVQVDGAPPSAGGGLYMFADPALERRSAGQRILLRMGPENAGRLIGKLTEVRTRIMSALVARGAGEGKGR